MKHAIQLLIGIFLFSLTTLAGASGQWDSLNLLKNVQTSKVGDGFIVRLEFEKPVSDFKEPEFFDKSVQVDFPLAFIKPAKKYYPADSFALTKVFAVQYDAQTLRVRFLKKDDSDIRDQFQIARQGRFVIVRLNQSAPVFQPAPVRIASSRQTASDALMSEDELAKFLSRASEKIRSRGKQNAPEKPESAPVQTPKVEKVEPTPDIKVTRAGMGVEPLVDQIRKVAMTDSKAEKKTDSKNPKKDRSKAKADQMFSLKDSRPTGKPIELVPSGMKMVSMLALVLGIMFLLFFGFKKYVLKNTMFGGGEKLVNVLGSGFLAPKKNIVLVEVAGEVLVLGMSQDHIALLTNITDPDKIEEIKMAGGKGGSGLSWNQANRQPEEAGVSVRKTAGQFSNYMKQFTRSEKITKEKSLADVTAQIRQQMGKFKTARA